MGLDQLTASGIGTGPLSPYESLVRSGDPEVVARALAKVDGVQTAVAPADWRRDGTAVITVIPTADGNSPEGRATLNRIWAATHDLPADVVTGGAAGAECRLPRLGLRQLPARHRAHQRSDVPAARAGFRSLILPLKAVLLNLLSVGPRAPRPSRFRGQ